MDLCFFHQWYGGQGQDIHYLCFVDDEGTKVVVYGGLCSPNEFDFAVDGELWILDLITSTLSQSLSSPPRMDAACTIAGNRLLVCCGTPNGSAAVPFDMIIYDFDASSYTHEYTPPPGYNDLHPPPPLTKTAAAWPTHNPGIRGGTDKDGKETGISPAGSNTEIVGCVIERVALLCVIAGISILWLRQRRKGQTQNEEEDSAQKNRETSRKLHPG